MGSHSTSSPTPNVALSSAPTRASPSAPTTALSSALTVASDQYGLISWPQVRDAGLTKNDVRRLLRNRTWGHPYTGVYSVRALLNRDSPDRHLRSAVMAAQLAMGPESFAAGETAALLWGMQGLPAWDGHTVHMVVPGLGQQRHVHSIALHTWKVRPGEVATDGPLRLTTPGRTLRDTLLRVGRKVAVCLMDSALNLQLIRQEDFERLEHANRGRRGCVRVRRWWPLADGRAQSPLETRVRLACVDGGLPPTDLQRSFVDGNGRLIGVVDFWWEHLKVIGEADGIGPHSFPQVLARDRERQNALQAWYPGVRIVRFTWQDLKRPGYILATVTQAGSAP